MSKKAQKRPRGRPALAKGEGKEVISLRLKPAEKSLFQKASDKEGLTLSDWLRKQALKSVSQ
jgi:uncharacterized protein (DUF1778 family)